MAAHGPLDAHARQIVEEHVAGRIEVGARQQRRQLDRRDAVGRREAAAVDDAQAVGRRAEPLEHRALDGRAGELRADAAGVRADRAQQLFGVVVVRLEEHVAEQRPQRRRVMPPQHRR